MHEAQDHQRRPEEADDQRPRGQDPDARCRDAEETVYVLEGTVNGAGTGGVIGGALGWIAGIGALGIPAAGPFIAAGPVIAALSGAAIGATVQPPPAPVLAAPTLADGSVKLRFASLAGKTYRVEFRAALGDPNWTSRVDLTGTGADLEFSEAAGVAGFYRVTLAQ